MIQPFWGYHRRDGLAPKLGGAKEVTGVGFVRGLAGGGGIRLSAFVRRGVHASRRLGEARTVLLLSNKTARRAVGALANLGQTAAMGGEGGCLGVKLITLRDGHGRGGPKSLLAGGRQTRVTRVLRGGAPHGCN